MIWQLVRGVPTLLVTRGSEIVEVTSNRRLTKEHALYERIGGDVTSLRFKKSRARSGY